MFKNKKTEFFKKESEALLQAVRALDATGDRTMVSYSLDMYTKSVFDLEDNMKDAGIGKRKIRSVLKSSKDAIILKRWQIPDTLEVAERKAEEYLKVMELLETLALGNYFEKISILNMLPIWLRPSKNRIESKVQSECDTFESKMQEHRAIAANMIAAAKAHANQK